MQGKWDLLTEEFWNNYIKWKVCGDAANVCCSTKVLYLNCLKSLKWPGTVINIVKYQGCKSGQCQIVIV